MDGGQPPGERPRSAHQPAFRAKRGHVLVPGVSKGPSESQLAGKRRRSALVTLLLTLLGVVAGGGLALRTRMVQRWLAMATGEVAERIVGQRVSLGGIRVEPLGPQIHVDGLVIMDPQTRHSSVVVRELVARFAWRWGIPVLEEVRVLEPVVHLHLDADGLREFRSAGGGGQTVRRRTPWNHLAVEDGRFVLELPEGVVEVSDIDLTPTATENVADLRIRRVHVAWRGLVQDATDLRIDGMTFGLDRLVLPNVDVRFPAVTVQGRLAAIQKGPMAGRLFVTSDLAEWDPILPSNLDLEGRAEVDVRLAGFAASPRMEGNLDFGAWVVTLVHPTTGRRSPIFLPPLSGHWALDQDRRLHLDDLRAGWAAGVVELSGVFDPRKKDVSAHLTMDGVQLSSALQLLSPIDAAWVDGLTTLDTEIAGSLSPFLLEGPFHLGFREFEVHAGPATDPATSLILDLPVLDADGQLSLERTGVEIRADQLDLSRTQGRARILVGYHGDGPMDARVTLMDTDFSEFGPLGGVGLGGRGVLQARIAGPFPHLTAAGRVSVRDFKALGVPFADEARFSVASSDMRTLSLRDIEARRRETRYRGNLDLVFGKKFTLDTQVVVEDGLISDLASLFVEIPGVDARVSGTLDLSGEPYGLDGAAELELRDASIAGEAFSSGSASGRMTAGEFTLKRLLLARRGGKEALLARGTVKRGFAADFDVTSDGLRLETLDGLKAAGLPLEGAVQVGAHVGGTLMDLEPHGRVTVTGARFHGRPLGDSRVWFDSDASRMSVAGALLGTAATLSGELGLQDGAWRAGLDLEDFPAHVLLPALGGAQPLDARVDGHVDVRGHGATPPDVEAMLSGVRVTWGDHRLASATPWRFSRAGTRMELSGVHLAGPDGTDLQAAGQRDPAGEVSFRGGGRVDLDWARLLREEVTRSAGEADVQVIVRGPLPAPDVNVQVSVKDAIFKSTWFPYTVEDLAGQVLLTPQAWTFDGLRGRLGGGQVKGSGVVRTDAWSPRQFNLQARMDDVRIKYLDDLPPMVGDASLSFDGPADSPVMSGDIDIREMVFSERIDWESWVVALREERLTAAAPEESGDYFDLDLRVRADGTGRIRNNVGNARLSADLRVVGDTSRPGVIGDVRVEPDSLIYLKERSFTTTRGDIRFLDPYTFDPELDFLLETEVESREQQYRVYYRITGLLSEWQATATSDPALSQADINWLLLFGATREELEEYGSLGGALAWESVDLLSSSLGLNQEVQRLGSGIFQVDRWDIVTGATGGRSGSLSSEPRLVVEKDIGPPWDVTLTGEVNVVQLGDSFASLEKRLARRLYVTAFWSSTQVGRSLDIGGAYGAEFILRWDLD